MNCPCAKVLPAAKRLHGANAPPRRAGPRSCPASIRRGQDKREDTLHSVSSLFFADFPSVDVMFLCGADALAAPILFCVLWIAFTPGVSAPWRGAEYAKESGLAGLRLRHRAGRASGQLQIPRRTGESGAKYLKKLLVFDGCAKKIRDFTQSLQGLGVRFYVWLFILGAYLRHRH